VNTTQQNYRNGAGNSHLSYSIITEKSRFSISKELKDITEINDPLEVYRSILIKELNAVKQVKSGFKEIYSLRWFSGMVIPLIAIILFGMKLYGIKRRKALLLIAQILFTADLVMLITKSLS
jgi:hypothetical protein